VVICLERSADLHMAQLMPLPLTVSCFSKIQIGFTFLVPAHPGSPGKKAVKQVCVCVCCTLCFFAIVSTPAVTELLIPPVTLTFNSSMTQNPRRCEGEPSGQIPGLKAI